jgi:glutamine cyclotransferase
MGPMPRSLSAMIVVVVLAVGACGDDGGERAAPPATSSPAAGTTVAGAGGTTDDEPVTTAVGQVLWPDDPAAPGVQQWDVEVIRRLAHDPEAFTQGLELDGDHLVESTGRRGISTLRRLDPSTGAVLASVDLDPTLFGEGLTVVDDEVIQLTWQAGRALRYRADSFDPVGEYHFDGEGWGLCHDGERLWMSDGTAVLTARDPETFAPTGTVTVTRDGVALDRLNELECVAGTVLANVWYGDEVVVIDPSTGAVEAEIDAGPLVAEIGSADPTAVLNGVADLGDGTLLLGGKNWPTFFVVRLTRAETGP